MIQDDKKNSSTGNSSEGQKIYLTSDSTLQTPEEHRHDQSVDPRKGASVQVSNEDLRETETDKVRSKMLDSDIEESERDL